MGRRASFLARALSSASLPSVVAVVAVETALPPRRTVGLAALAAAGVATTEGARAALAPRAREIRGVAFPPAAVLGAAVAGAPAVRVPHQAARAALQAVRGPHHPSREPPPRTPAAVEAGRIRAAVELGVQGEVARAGHPLPDQAARTVRPTPVAAEAAGDGLRPEAQVARASSSFDTKSWRPSPL